MPDEPKDLKISELPLRVAMQGTDQFPIVASGKNYKATAQSLIPLLPAGPPGPIGPPGNNSQIDGIATLRELPVIAGKMVWLSYHTTPGDLGSGLFYGVTTAGPYVDNNGTIVVSTDTSKAWLRVWDRVKAHVGWFGAKCQPGAGGVDDYVAVQKCFDLFTSGRTTGSGYGGDTIPSGIIDVGPGFNFSQPLIYGGSLGGSFKLIGTISQGRGGMEKSLLYYTGPQTHASIIFYGANEWQIDDINTFPNLALAGILVTADNTYNNLPVGIHTTSAAITAGTDVVVSPLGGSTPAEKVQYLQPGCFLGVGGKSVTGGAAAGADFEIIYITAVNRTTGTFTADFKKNHAIGSLLGGGAPCSSGWVNRCRLMASSSPIWTKTSVPAVDLGPDGTGLHIWRITVDDISGIKVGHPVKVGCLLYAQIMYPLLVNIGAKYFESYGSYGHTTGTLIMYPTSAMSFGNRLLSTVQVDNVTFNDNFWVGATLRNHPGTSTSTADCYAGFRQIWGGNIKAFMFNNQFASVLRCAFACEQSSGQYHFNGGTSAGISECLWWNITATMTVLGWEDESSCMWVTGLGGSSPSQATFIACTMQGQCPDQSIIVEATDEMFLFAGQLTFIGCGILNNRNYGVSLPIITVTGLQDAGGLDIYPSGLSLINCTIYYVAVDSNWIWNSPGNNTTDVIKDGTGNLTMLNCTGAIAGNNVRLPNVIPPLKKWQKIVTGLDPVSLAIGEVSPVHAAAVPGAVLGDLVEASFSLDLQGVQLSAWVSAPDVVHYQFFNPRGAVIDLAAGDVKVRVRK